MFLEVSIKPKDFPVILQPWGLYSGNVVILWGSSVLEEGELSDAFGEFVNEVLIDILLGILFFLLYTAVNKIELLSLVEALLIRITEDVAWEERNLFGKVFLHSKFIFIYKLYFVN